MFYAFLLTGLALELVRAAQAGDECEEVASSEPNTCKACSAVVNGKKYCSQCNGGGSQSAPTDGVCSADNNECTRKQDGKCTQCANKSFMYKGGCYKDSQAPGNTMCETANAGVCTQAKEGYFLPPGTDNAHDSVVSCGDTTGVTLTGDKKYTGVAECVTCTQPGQLSIGGTKAAICTKCAADLYLKIDRGVMECVAESGCGEGFFPTIVDGVKKCAGCSEAGSGGIEDCELCIPRAPAPEAGVKVTCSKCHASKKVSPLKDECMDNCPAGTYDKQNVCTPCHSSCASCQTDDKETSCTACYPGHSLLYEANGATGRCVKECTGAFITNCADGQCTADVGGAKYCAQCKEGYAPIDGVCTAVKIGRDASVCTAASGKCTACTGAYALISGGCYGVAKLPGKAVCTAANNGECTTCANGQQPSGKVCPTCPAGCSKCTGSAPSQQCSECFPGYYKSGTKCVACDKDDGSIKGVPNCLSCKEPASSSGAVTCYLTQQKTDDGTGGDTGGDSMNKSGLSTGAIAGISVAAIVVVGGLVGFLCWWFICRGKA
uniref:Variant-specific surface protein AS11 n=1 Tax=Giardia intestinalis TaxID=5741 RepID=Q8I8V2_GIAIN|nr:variant-specific surface protein AS11 [Giardia intestinalis]